MLFDEYNMHIYCFMSSNQYYIYIYILNNSWISMYTFADTLYFLRINYQLKRVILLQNWDPKGILKLAFI